MQSLKKRGKCAIKDESDDSYAIAPSFCFVSLPLWSHTAAPFIISGVFFHFHIHFTALNLLPVDALSRRPRGDVIRPFSLQSIDYPMRFVV
jgi:hypothetical protein